MMADPSNVLNDPPVFSFPFCWVGGNNPTEDLEDLKDSGANGQWTQAPVWLKAYPPYGLWHE